MAEPEIEAVRETLASYLATALAAQFPSLRVLAEWPGSASLPEQAISVLATGEHEVFPHAPVVISTNPGTPPNGTVTYEYGKIEGLQLELDCWAATKPKRDALQMALRRALNQPPQLTLPGANDGRPRLAHRNGLSLSIANLYGAIFTYRFKQVPAIVEGSEQAQRNEWRSHFRGTADGPLWEQDASMALRKSIKLTGKIGPEPLGHGGIPINKTRPAAQVATVVIPVVVTLARGQSFQLKAVALYDDNTALDVTATAAWLSTAPLVVSVSSSGLITDLAAGSANVSATVGGFAGICAVTAH